MIGVRRKLHGKGRLRSHMTETVAAMGRQRVVGRIRRYGAIKIHGDNRCIRAGNAKVDSAELAGAMKQGCQQTKHERSHKRQAALPSVTLSCTDLSIASHALPLRSLSGLFKAGETVSSSDSAQAEPALVMIWMVVCWILKASSR